MITRTRLLGAGARETAALPTRLASPAQVFTSPRAISPPPARGRRRAGRAALYIEAVRLMAARKRMRWSTPRFWARKTSPAFATCQVGSRGPVSAAVWGSRTARQRAAAATVKVERSTAITAPSPPKAKTALARMGASTVTRELERARSPLTWWYCSRGTSRLTATSEAGC